MKTRSHDCGIEADARPECHMARQGKKSDVQAVSGLPRITGRKSSFTGEMGHASCDRSDYYELMTPASGKYETLHTGV